MIIKKALPDVFHYLDNLRILKSTNGLESFFGHLKTMCKFIGIIKRAS